MVDRERLSKLVRDLETYLVHIEELRGVDKQRFLTDWKIYDLADRSLHLAIETFLSIGDMLISEFRFKRDTTMLHAFINDVTTFIKGK